MLKDYFSCYKLKIQVYPTPFHKEKNSPKLKDFQIFNVIKVVGYSNIGVHKFPKEKKYFLIFYNFIPKKVSTYHTGSAFTQRHYVCRVLFILNTLCGFSIQ